MINRLSLLLLSCFAAAQSVAAAESNPSPLALGAPAPEFNLPGVDGRDYSLGDFAAAEVLVVVFTCNHCPTAQYYEERLKKLTADYKDKGAAVVAISPNDPKAVRLDELGYTDLGDTFKDMKVRAQHKEFNFPYLYDGDIGAVSRAYGPVATPHVFVFDSKRKLRYTGRIDDSEREQFVKVHDTRNAVDALLAGTAPPVATTKVVGCTVKWSGKNDTVQAYMARLAAEPVKLESADADVLRALRKNESGKVRLVNFWATWCAPCVAEFDEFVTLNRMYRQRDFEMVLVSMNRPDEEANVLAFLKKHQASNRNLLFASPERDALIDAFDQAWPGAIPFTVLISPEGKILHRELGSIDALQLRRKILEALNERKPW